MMVFHAMKLRQGQLSSGHLKDLHDHNLELKKEQNRNQLK